ncbi:uncharacterized protein RB166_004409 [Leptodactylus fuscus]
MLDINAVLSGWLAGIKLCWVHIRVPAWKRCKEKQQQDAELLDVLVHNLDITLVVMIILACICTAINVFAVIACIIHFICKRCKNKQHQDAELLDVIVHNLAEYIAHNFGLQTDTDGHSSCKLSQHFKTH